jgi:hypothetical protein
MKLLRPPFFLFFLLILCLLDIKSIFPEGTGKKRSLVVLPLEVKGIDDENLKLGMIAIRNEFTKLDSPFDVIAFDKVEKQLKLLEQKQMLGSESCSVDNKCTIKIGKALDSELLFDGAIILKSNGEIVVTGNITNVVNQQIEYSADATETTIENTDKACKQMAYKLVVQINDPQLWKSITDKEKAEQKQRLLDEADRKKQKEREAENKRKRGEEEEARRKANEAEAARAADFKEKNALFRFAFSGINLGGFNTLTNEDPTLTAAYGGGWGGFIDWVAKAPPLGYTPGLFLNFYMRAVFRKYTMTDTGLLTNTAYLEKGTIDQFGIDTGLRFSAGLYFLWMEWSFYVGAAPRIHIYTETAGSLSNTFWSLGVVCNAGLEIAIFPTLAIFAEANIGYVPVGASEANVEGLQIYAGLSIRQ